MVDAQIGAKGSVLIMVSFALTLAASPAQASLTLFLGADDGAGSLASAPNSTAAAASFDAAVAGLGIEHTITFENSPLGTFSSLDLGSVAMVRASLSTFPTPVSMAELPSLGSPMLTTP